MATSRMSMAAPGMPRGVDLNLDKFNLSSAGEAGSWTGTVQAPSEAKHLTLSSEAFLSNLNSSASAFAGEEKKLLEAVFNPSLSDRQAEGDLFLPPPTHIAHISKLRTLIKAEANVREQRKAHFFSNRFAVDNVGPLFPLSWTSTIELGNEQNQSQTDSVSLQSRPDLMSEEGMLREALESAVPTFRRSTEDGLTFLIYRLGSLEVRATEEKDGSRTVGAVFSMSPAAQQGSSAGRRRASVKEADRIVKVTEYVEKSQQGALQCQYYVVFHTESGNMILTEKLANGTVAWKEDPAGLEDRNSLAKVVRSAACSSPGATVFSMRSVEASTPSLSPKHYAHSAYSRASGEPKEVRRYDGRPTLQYSRKMADKAPELVMHMRALAARPGF